MACSLIELGLKIGGIALVEGVRNKLANDVDSNRVKYLLQTMQAKLEDEIKDYAEESLRSAHSYVRRGFAKLMFSVDEFSDNQSLVIDESCIERLDDVGQDARKQLLSEALAEFDKAHFKAYRAFNLKTNLNFCQRLRAMQLIMLCDGLKHLDQPMKIMIIWKINLDELFADSEVIKCINLQLKGTNWFKKFYHNYTNSDFDHLVVLLQEVIKQLIIFGDRKEIGRGRVELFIFEHILSRSELRQKRSGMIQRSWLHTLKYEDDLFWFQYEKASSQLLEYRFLVGSSGLDGNLFIHQGKHSLLKLDQNLAIEHRVDGTYCDICYDPFRQRLWGCTTIVEDDESVVQLVEINEDTLEPRTYAMGEEMIIVYKTSIVTNWHPLRDFEIPKHYFKECAKKIFATSNDLKSNFPVYRIYANENGCFILAGTLSYEERLVYCFMVCWWKINTKDFPRGTICSLVGPDRVAYRSTMAVVIADETTVTVYKIKIYNKDVHSVERINFCDQDHNSAKNCSLDERGRLFIIQDPGLVVMMDKDWEVELARLSAPHIYGDLIVARSNRIYIASPRVSNTDGEESNNNNNVTNVNSSSPFLTSAVDVAIEQYCIHELA